MKFGILVTTMLVSGLGCQSQTPPVAQKPPPPIPADPPPPPKPTGPQPINTDFAGITCFRGNATRTYYGEAPIPTGNVVTKWRQSIGSSGRWNGVGWTGQPLIVEWPEATRAKMNFLTQPGPKLEVIVGALDGQVHFFDAETGKRTRKTLPTPGRYPIKGTVSVDPRGYPLIYVGCGVNIGGKPGFRIFSLLDFKELLYLPANNPKAPRKWPGSDSNVLVLDDVMYLPAESGLFYRVKLNAKWDGEQVSIKPVIEKVVISRPGSENSMAVWQDRGYFADNAGSLFSVNLAGSPKIKKLAELGDDTDSSLVIDNQGHMYVGIEKDKRTGPGAKGIIYKLTREGKALWKWEFEAGSIVNVKPPNNPINGGILSTGALSEDQKTIYYTTSHHPKIGRGFLVALDTETGKLKWKLQLRGFSWSSPIVRDGVVLACDSTGTVYIRDAATGDSKLDTEWLSLGANIEASPIVWKGRVYVGLRGGALVCIGNP